MIAVGVFRGAPTPYHELASKPGTKSLSVGMSGNSSQRIAVVTASGRTVPALTYSIDPGAVPNSTCTCPPRRSVNAGAKPRYGTWIILTLVIILNNSPATCCGLPMPGDAMLILPGLAFAWAMNSATVLAGNDGWTTRTFGTRLMLATGAISRM